MIKKLIVFYINIYLIYITMNWDCKEKVLEIIKDKGYNLKNVSSRLKDDKDVVITAVKNYSISLMFASDRLKNDKEVVVVAVLKYGFSIQYASNQLRDDKEMVMKAISQSGGAIAYASDRLKKDKEVVLKSLENSSLALIHTSEELKDDYQVVMKAVKLNASALDDASERLKDDKKVVIQAVSSVGLAFKYASIRLQMDREIILTSLNNIYYGDSYSYITDKRKQELENDPAYLLICYYKKILPFNNKKLYNIHQYIKKYFKHLQDKKLQILLNRQLFIEEDKRKKLLNNEKLPNYNINNEKALINSIPLEISIIIKEFIIDDTKLTSDFYIDEIGKTPFTPQFMYKMKENFMC